MAGIYNYWLVALSLLLAIGASHTALDLAGRTAEAQGRMRVIWLVGGATSMGLGIWSMHFVGMLAFSLPVEVRYHLPTVFLSWIAAVLASGVALFVVSRQRMTLSSALVGSLTMGCGIAAMHYIGMAAMRLDAGMVWSGAIVTLSVVIAIAVSLVALVLAFRFRSEKRDLAPLKLLSAVVMGFAVVAMPRGVCEPWRRSSRAGRGPTGDSWPFCPVDRCDRGTCGTGAGDPSPRRGTRRLQHRIVTDAHPDRG